MTDLLDKRLVFVTGKGGTGKSTVAAALGLAAARRGKRTIVCEIARQERMARLLDDGDAPASTGHTEREIAPHLHAISIDPEEAMKEYLRRQIGSAALSGLLTGSQLFQYLAVATPGLGELVTIGKIWELAQLERITQGGSPYDLVIVDAPATGHGLGFLRTPRTFRDVARVGPIRRQADIIDAFIVDRSLTGVVVVALPEEMAVNEAIELSDRLGEEMAMVVDTFVVNGLYPERFTGDERERLAAVAAAGDGDAPTPGARAAVRAALFEAHRAQAHRAELARLRAADRAPTLTLPFLFDAEPGLRSLEELADRFGRAA